MQTFVQFERKDGTQDYGYLAVAPGDPEAKEDAPDLMLYVIRDAKNAKAKGIEPVSKEALLEMAQTIAASVKRRPVSQSENTSPVTVAEDLARQAVKSVLDEDGFLPSDAVELCLGQYAPLRPLALSLEPRSQGCSDLGEDVPVPAT